jgi:hypothetical protein
MVFSYLFQANDSRLKDIIKAFLVFNSIGRILPEPLLHIGRDILQVDILIKLQIFI